LAMEDVWFYAFEGTQNGPASQDELRIALIQGRIDRQSLVWRKGMAKWQPLETVRDLRPLLEHLPPQLPPQTPTTPNQPQRTEETKQPRGEFLGERGRWALGGILSALWDWILGKWVLSCLAGTVGVVLIFFNPWRPPTPTPTPKTVVVGQLHIDANPWGQVEWIRGPDGNQIDLPPDRTTPFLITVPTGQYEALVTYPHGQVSDRCELPVQPDQITTCFLALAPVDATSYFQKLGW